MRTNARAGWISLAIRVCPLKMRPIIIAMEKIKRHVE
jgi:hypothetical protein